MNWEVVLVYVVYIEVLLWKEGDIVWLIYGMDGLVILQFDWEFVLGFFVICLDVRIDDGYFVGKLQGFFIDEVLLIYWVEFMGIIEVVYQIVFCCCKVILFWGELYIFIDSV